MEYKNYLKKIHKNSLIVYVAFMASIVIYFIVFEVLNSSIPDFQGFMEKFDLPWMRYAFYALGLLQVFLIKFIRDTSIKGLTMIDEKTLIIHLSKISTVSAALCEVPAILGLVLFFLSGSTEDFYVLLFISLALFVLFFPRYANWEEWIESRTSH
jgi:hypothetical protein